MMMAPMNSNLLISSAVVCAVSSAFFTDYWSSAYWAVSDLVCSDVVLYLIAALAYFVLVHFRQRSTQRGTPKKIVDDLCITTTEECSVECVEIVTEAVQPTHAGIISEEMGVETIEEPSVVVEQEEDQSDSVAQMTQHHVELMQTCASERNIGGVMRSFRLLQQSGADLSSLMYNTVLRTWISCGNIQAAEDWMKDIIEAGMADESSFSMLIKALVMAHSPDQATALMKDMRTAGIQPNVSTFNELLIGFAQDGLSNKGLSLLEEMDADGVQPTSHTRDTITKLLNGSRDKDQSFDRVSEIVSKYEIETHTNNCSPHLLVPTLLFGTEPKSSLAVIPALPRIAATIVQGEKATSRLCAHEVHATGSLAQVKAFRKTLSKRGFLTKDACSEWPLNGHWETDHGMTVIVEGKLVRWSQQRASRLRFTGKDRTTCELALYGEAANGRLVTPATAPGATRELRWDNGDVWHSYDGRVIDGVTLFQQTMSKTLLDHMQDAAYRARSDGVLACVSKQRMGMPLILEDLITQFLGNDLHYVRVHFESKWNPSSASGEAEIDIVDTLSRLHARLGLRHCWAEQTAGNCGQRTLANGNEVSEDIFNRHIKAVRTA